MKSGRGVYQTRECLQPNLTSLPINHCTWLALRWLFRAPAEGWVCTVFSQQEYAIFLLNRFNYIALFPFVIALKILSTSRHIFLTYEYNHSTLASRHRPTYTMCSKRKCPLWFTNDYYFDEGGRFSGRKWS